MLIPHLLFAHMLADYVLQTNWLVARKGSTWYGLALHGAIVGLTSGLALAPYLGQLWFLLIALTALHTAQDYLKVHYGPRLVLHPFWPYLGDQLLHYLAIGGFQLLAADLLTTRPQAAELAFMWLGTLSVAATHYYEVTWWANWLDMIPYFNRWRIFGYVERLSIAALAAAGAWPIAPLAVLPRMIAARRAGQPLWRQRRGPLELITGIAFSLALGLGLRALAGGL